MKMIAGVMIVRKYRHKLDIMFKVDFNTIPESAGTYIFKDNENKPIYVGKAINLKHRVKSYFVLADDASVKTKKMIGKAMRIEFIRTLSELEALILEAGLIKKYRPEFNVSLKDDKSYQYIVIDKRGILPSVITVRRAGNYKVVFGPFPQGKTVRKVYWELRKIFKFCTLSPTQFKKHRKIGKPCQYYHLGLCEGVCAGHVSDREYRKTIQELIAFLSNRKNQIESEWRQRLQSEIKAERFEQANALKSRLAALAYIRQKINPVSSYLEKPELYEDLRQAELDDLKSVLHGTEIFRIECFDISNISGSFAVASKVCFERGEPDKKAYRHYKIKTVRGISDVAMIREVILRRFASKTDLLFPNLVVVDGGKPQVKTAAKALFLHTPASPAGRFKVGILGLAKRRETIISFNDDGSFKSVNLSRDRPALQLLQRIRDEAHRFALGYHRKLRQKALELG